MSLENATLDSNPNNTFINGNNSQSSVGFTGNEHVLNNFVTHLGLDGLPKGRVIASCVFEELSVDEGPQV